MSNMFFSSVQPILGVLRPPKDAKHRNMFNWTHGSIGFAASLLSGGEKLWLLVTLFFALAAENSSTSLPPQKQTKRLCGIGN